MLLQRASLKKFEVWEGKGDSSFKIPAYCWSSTDQNWVASLIKESTNQSTDLLGEKERRLEQIIIENKSALSEITLPRKKKSKQSFPWQSCFHVECLCSSMQEKNNLVHVIWSKLRGKRWYSCKVQWLLQCDKVFRLSRLLSATCKVTTIVSLVIWIFYENCRNSHAFIG